MIHPPNAYIEQTNLNPALTGKDIDLLIGEAVEYDFKGVCLPPFWVKKASRELSATAIQLVTVIGFPFGYQQSDVKLKEIDLAIADGADELDLVMNVSAFKSGMSWPKIEIAKCAKLAHEQGKILKVIVETALLSTQELIQACKVVADSGADYIKTSTGFASRGASIEDIFTMKSNLTNQLGIKASGGIKTLSMLEALVDAGAERIGTSSGVQIMKEYKNG